jgi:hypothetical protein
MLPLRDHCTELPAGITLIEPATGGLFTVSPAYRTSNLSAGWIVRTRPCRDAGHTEFAAGQIPKATNRPQRVPFQSAARCRRGEWDKPLRALNPFNHIFFLSNNHLQALPRPKPLASYVPIFKFFHKFAGYDGFIRKMRRTTIRYEISDLREFGLGWSERSQQRPDR